MNNHIFSHLVHTPVNTFGVAKPVQSMFVPSIKTLEVEKAANDDVLEVNFRELKKLAEKMKWMERFTKSYSEGLCPTTSAHFEAKDTKFIVASIDAKDVGYVGLIKCTCDLPTGAIEYWILETAYVKRQYRGLGVFQKLIAHVTDVYEVKQIHLEAYRFYDHQYYYECLGFTEFVYVDDTELGFAVHDSFNDLLPVILPIAA